MTRMDSFTLSRTARDERHEFLLIECFADNAFDQRNFIIS